ncbi:MAG: hypothetical protein ACOCG5_11045 [Candidatus Alkaliphilus sp. MAG34]
MGQINTRINALLEMI